MRRTGAFVEGGSMRGSRRPRPNNEQTAHLEGWVAQCASVQFLLSEPLCRPRGNDRLANMSGCYMCQLR